MIDPEVKITVNYSCSDSLSDGCVFSEVKRLLTVWGKEQGIPVGQGVTVTLTTLRVSLTLSWLLSEVK